MVYSIFYLFPIWLKMFIGIFLQLWFLTRNKINFLVLWWLGWSTTSDVRGNWCTTRGNNLPMGSLHFRSSSDGGRASGADCEKFVRHTILRWKFRRLNVSLFGGLPMEHFTAAFPWSIDTFNAVTARRPDDCSSLRLYQTVKHVLHVQPTVFALLIHCFQSGGIEVKIW